jgi:hypothetical protein
VVSESSWTVTVVTASVKEDVERRPRWRCFWSMERMLGSLHTFPRRLFWRRWQPKFSKLSQHFYFDLVREISDSTSHDLLGCSAVQFGRCPPTLQVDVLPLSLGLKTKPSKQKTSTKQVASRAVLASFLPGLLFGPEDGGAVFLWNIITLLSYTV